MFKNIDADRYNFKTISNLLRFISILAIVAVLIYIILNLDYTPDKIENINGRILILGEKPALYTPSAGEVVKWLWQGGHASGKFECKINNDTIIISSRDNTLNNNEQRTKSGLHFYKYVPFENVWLEPLKALNDTLIEYYSVRYNKNSENFLCGRRFNGVSCDILLSKDFDSLKFYSSIYIDQIDSNVTTYFNCAYNGVVYSKLWKSYYKSFEDLSIDKVTLEIPGRIYAVSNSGNQLIYQSDFYPNKNSDIVNELYIYDFIKKTHIKLDIDASIANICFSPNDQYIAYTDITSNFANDVFLHIYDIETKKDINTGVELDISSSLATWVN